MTRASATPGVAVRRRVALLGALVVVALVGARPGTVAARFDAQVAPVPSVFPLLSLGAPTALTATPTSTGVTLSWSPGINQSGFLVSGASGDANGSCGAAAFAPVAATPNLSYLDGARTGPGGTWFCYLVKSTLGPWTSVEGNPVTAVQLGFVVAAVAASNGGVAGKLDVGDQFVVRFNQPVDPATGPGSADTVCASTSGAIVLGAVATTGGCTAGEANHLGQLDSGKMSHNVRWSASYTWSDRNQTLTVVLLAKVNGPNALFTTGPWTFQPTTAATSLLSATGAAHVCSSNSGGGNCVLTVSGAL